MIILIPSGAFMKNAIKVLMTAIVMASLLVGCQSMTKQPTQQPNITGTDVI